MTKKETTPEPEDWQDIKQRILIENKRVRDSNLMLLAFLATLLVQKHQGKVVVHKDAVQANFNKYNVTWSPVIPGADHFVMEAKLATNGAKGSG